jgi:outer membrane protein assembly factor BamB
MLILLFMKLDYKTMITLLSIIAGGILLSSSLVVSNPSFQQAEAQSLSRAERNWEMINHNEHGTNHNPQTILNNENVQHAELKWIFPVPSPDAVGGEGLIGFTATPGTIAPPLVVDGVAIMVMNYQTVFAVDMTDGSTIWTRTAEYNLESANVCGADVKDSRDLLPNCLPIYNANAHTHSVYYQELHGTGIVWLNAFGCTIQGIDVKTGEDVFTLTEFCMNVPTNAGVYNGQGSHAPVVDAAGDQLILAIGGHLEGTWGGRGFVAAYDLSSCSSFPCEIDGSDQSNVNWRYFFQPPNEELFPAEYKAWGDMLVDTCSVGMLEGISTCDVPEEILRNDWNGENGGIPFNTGISNVWGEIVVDEESRSVYFGTAQPGPDWNATYTSGPRLFGSAVMAVDADSGSLQWYFQSTTRDLWDMDCSWNTLLGDIDGKKTVFKGCKNGHVHAFDAASGDPLWITEVTGLRLSGFWCNDPCTNGSGPNNGLHGRGVLHSPALGIDGLNANNDWFLLDPRNAADMEKDWQHQHTDIGQGGFWQNPAGSGCIEADMAWDGERVFSSCKNEPGWYAIGPVEARGGYGMLPGSQRPEMPFDPDRNHTITAMNAKTGAIEWTFFVDVVPHRGGVISSGGVVYWNGYDGRLRAVDSATGEILNEFNLGTALDVMPTIGADSNGEIRLLQSYGGRSVTSLGLRNRVPGALNAFGLPDSLPAPVIQQVEVEKIVEVEKVVEVEKEVVKEVEVEKEVIVTEEVVSPVSYIAIGLGVVLIVISGVLYQRGKSS